MLDVFKHSLLIDATDQSKIGSDQDRIRDYTPFHFSQTLLLDESTPVYLFLLSAAAAASLIAWWAASGAQAIHSTTWSWSRSSHLQNRAINAFSLPYPTFKAFKINCPYYFKICTKIIKLSQILLVSRFSIFPSFPLSSFFVQFYIIDLMKVFQRV